MSAEEVMARALRDAQREAIGDRAHPLYEGISKTSFFIDKADVLVEPILAALHAAGYRIVGPEHLDAMVDAMRVAIRKQSRTVPSVNLSDSMAHLLTAALGVVDG